MEETRDLLVEIGTEELPPTALKRLSEAFVAGLKEELAQHHLAYTGITPYAAPRRLALIVGGLVVCQPDQELTRRGPALKAAFDSAGNPTKAAEGFARSCGVTVAELLREETPQGTWLAYRQAQQGRPTVELIPGMVERALGTLPIPKRMRWGAGTAEFVRPVHWVVLLFGEEVVPGTVLDVAAGGMTFGHRFHHPGPIALGSPADYAPRLGGEGFVEPDFARRRARIAEQVAVLAAAEGGTPVIDDDLLDEVTALNEWPTALVGGFDAAFLEVPSEALIETMQKNQKYFALRGPDGALLARFITVCNIESRDPAQVRAGNERVIRPRFSDAAFFWHQDLKQPLEAYGARLATVVFQEKLGTLAEKSARVGQLCRYIAGRLGLDEELAARSAVLGKCDLMTHMVFELPSLQGTMGRYYAERAGEHPCVAAAMEEQYLPRHAGDRLPASDCGRVLSIAEKLDTLVGIFAIGQRPTGVKDPYALRRAAIGLLRILIETPYALDLKELLEFAAEELRAKLDARAAAGEVLGYCMERLAGYYQDRGIGGDVVDAVLALGASEPADIHRRILAVEAFRRLPAAEALTAANKRIRNILRKAEEAIPEGVDAAALVEDAERRLALRVGELGAAIAPLRAAQDYGGVLTALAGLREEVDAFFDQVMVMAEDPAVRRNRLALLKSLEGMFLGVADISRLQ